MKLQSDISKIIIFLAIIISSAHAVSISACTNLNSANTLYQMTANINFNANTQCMNFSANGVILDCAGFNISSTGTGSTSKITLNATRVNNITIKNCNLYNSSFGLLLNSINDSLVQNLFINGSSQDGIRVAQFGKNMTWDNINVSNQTGNFGINIGNTAVAGGIIASNMRLYQAQLRFQSINDSNFTNVFLDSFYSATGDRVRMVGWTYNNGSGMLFDKSNDYLLENSTINVTAGSTALSIHDFGGPSMRFNATNINITNGATCFLITGSNNTNAFNIRCENQTTGISLTQNTANNNFTYFRITNATNWLTSLSATSNNNFVNSSLEYNSTVGKSNWSSVAFGAVQLINGNVTINHHFISLNDTAVPSFNNTAMLTLLSENCANTSIVKKQGYQTALSDFFPGAVFIGGAVTCSNGIANFSEASFSGYALGPSIAISANVNAANETEIRLLTANASSSQNMTAYNISIYYNNTLVHSSVITGANTGAPSNNTTVVAPLVYVNTTNIPYNASISALIGGIIYTASTSLNQSVATWYAIGNYILTIGSLNTTEDSSAMTVAPPSMPGNATTRPSESYSYVVGANCEDKWASNNTNNTNHSVCDSSLLSVSSMTSLSRLPSHRMEYGINTSLIMSFYKLNRTYDLSFGPTPESISFKRISVNNSEIGSDRYVWLADVTSGSPYNISSAGPRILFNTTVKDEINGSIINADTYSAPLEVKFSDGTRKQFNVSYSTINNTIVKVWPTSGTFKIYGYEEYDKTAYTTRRKIYADLIDFSTTNNYTQYLLSFSSPGATSVQIIVNGLPDANYVKVFKRSGFSSIELDDRYLGTNFNTFGVFIQDAFYTVYVYDAEGNLLGSQSNMQVDCSISCRLVIGGGGINTTIYQPFNYVINCQNNVTYGPSPPGSFRNVTPVFAAAICQVLDNPGNFTFTIKNIINQSVTCTNSTISSQLSCAMNVNATNIWQVTVNVGNVTYVVASGGFNPANDIIFNKDASIIWVLGTIALMLFLWHNMILSGMVLIASSLAGANLSILPNELGLTGILLGAFIFVLGVFKRK